MEKEREREREKAASMAHPRFKKKRKREKKAVPSQGNKASVAELVKHLPLALRNWTTLIPKCVRLVVSH